jgi:hypothetical protein
MDLAIPWGFIRKSRFLHRFSHTLIYYIRRKIIFIGDRREVKMSVIIVNLPTTGSFLKLQLSLTDLIVIVII